MRISTNVLFTSGAAKLSDLQSDLSKVQEQIAAGRRILTPADDPVGAAQSLVVKQNQAVNAQYGVNREAAKNALSHEESVLQNVTGLLQDAKTLIVSAGTPVITAEQRKDIATELDGILDQMLGFANSTDGNGNYIFGGYDSKNQPFTRTAAGATYDGDQGQISLQVGSTRSMQISNNGAAVFQNIRNGNGIFQSGANPNNTGTGMISPGTVVGNYSGSSYQISFKVDDTTHVTTYDITTVPDGDVVSADNPYTEGAAIRTADGWQVDIKGAPADGDSFSIGPAKNQSIFETLSKVIGALRDSSATGAMGQAMLTNALSEANGNVGNALDNVLSVRTSVGIRLKEIDTLDSEGEARDILFEQQLQTLDGLDYTKAITELTKQQTILQAAQQSYLKMTNLSLFNYIN